MFIDSDSALRSAQAALLDSFAFKKGTERGLQVVQ